jgi:hypothetical protein
MGGPEGRERPGQEPPSFADDDAVPRPVLVDSKPLAVPRPEYKLILGKALPQWNHIPKAAGQRQDLQQRCRHG